MRHSRTLMLVSMVALLSACDSGDSDDAGPAVALDLFRSGTTVSLDWNDLGTEDGYRIYRSTGDGASVLHDTVAQDVTTYDDGGVPPGEKYSYRIVAIEDDGGTILEREESATKTADYVKLLTPDGGESLTKEDVYQITWETNLSPADGDWVLYVSTDGGSSYLYELVPSNAPEPFSWRVGYEADGTTVNAVSFVSSDESDCVVRIIHYSDTQLGGHLNDQSDASFSIDAGD